MEQTTSPNAHRPVRLAALVTALALTAAACAGLPGGSSPDEGFLPSAGGQPSADGPTTSSGQMPAHANGDHSGSHDHAGMPHEAAMALVDLSMVTHVATESGDWSSPATWQSGVAPTELSRVHIPEGVTVAVDAVNRTNVKTVRVDGTLRFDPSVTTELRVDTLVTTPGSRLEMGTAEAPIAPDVTATLVFADDGPIDHSVDPTLVGRGAILHGATVMHGSPKTTFAPVAQFPVVGDTSVTLTEAPTGWTPGDTIVIAGTDPKDPTSDEQRTISSIDGATIVFDQPLALDHRAPRADLEVHVANLTRNVQVTSANRDVARRGHVMIAHTNNASIDYVWFSGLGRSDKAKGYDDHEFVDLNPYIPANVIGGDNVRGRYSLHFHRGGTTGTQPARVNGSVVSDDPGWGFVNHSSHVDFTNNAAYDIVGAAYYTEAGDEIGSFIGNIAIRIVNPNYPLETGIDGEEVDPDAREGRMDFGFQGDGMWLHSTNVRVERNVFSGISGHAFIVWPEGLLERNGDGSTSKVFHDAANVRGGELIGPAGTRMQIMDVPVGSFDGNQMYSATRGVQLFYLHTEFFGGGLHYEDCTIDPPAAYDEQLRSTFTNSTIWNVDEVAFAAPYTNRITIDGLRIVGDGSDDTIGIDVGHFMNERGIDINSVTVEDFGIGVRVSAVAEVNLGPSSLSNGTDVQYVIPNEDGPGRIVDGPRAVELDEIERDNSHLSSCTPGQPPADMEDPEEEFEDDEAFEEEDDEEFDDFEDED